jgi:hypothetical protein
MILYIQVENGQPVNHPALEQNLLEALGRIPEGWEPFVRVPKPIPPLYKKLELETPVYEKIDGVWTDVWSFRDMTPEEKEDYQQFRKRGWAQQYNAYNFTAWVFNEETAEFEPPIPRPQVEGVNYRWDGAQNAWREAPVKPVDGNSYRFDFIAWEWVVL